MPIDNSTCWPISQQSERQEVLRGVGTCRAEGARKIHWRMVEALGI